MNNTIPGWKDRLQRIEARELWLGRWIFGCWILFGLCFAVVSWLYIREAIKITDVGGMLQGTIGVTATVISVLYLLRGIYGNEKEIVLASQQSHVQSQEQKLDRALQGRAALVSQRNSGNGGIEAVVAHAQHLLRQCRSYLGDLNTVEVVRKTARNEIPQNVLMDRYVNHLKLVFTMAAAADQGSDPNRLVDHVWHSLMVEERALAVVLIACGEDIPRPSHDALSGWKLAIEPYLPWNARSVNVRELFA